MENQNDLRNQQTKNRHVQQHLKDTHEEGPVAKSIEKETSKLSSDLFLWAGLSLLTTSVVLHGFRMKHAGLMIGQFAAPLLIMGLYNKTVKQSGHDYLDKKPL